MPEPTPSRCSARFRGKGGLHGWCPGCGRRLVEFLVVSIGPDWIEFFDSGIRYYRCPSLRTVTTEAVIAPATSLVRKVS